MKAKIEKNIQPACAPALKLWRMRPAGGYSPLNFQYSNSISGEN
jgi:hypothetical protein